MQSKPSEDIAPERPAKITVPLDQWTLLCLIGYAEDCSGERPLEETALWLIQRQLHDLVDMRHDRTGKRLHPNLYERMNKRERGRAD